MNAIINNSRPSEQARAAAEKVARQHVIDPFFSDLIWCCWCSVLDETVRCHLQCESKKSPPPEVFQHFLQNGWEFLIHFLHTCYMFLSTLDYKFLFNYLQLWWSYYAILSVSENLGSRDFFLLTLYSSTPEKDRNKSINNCKWGGGIHNWNWQTDRKLLRDLKIMISLKKKLDILCEVVLFLYRFLTFDFIEFIVVL